MKHSATKTLEFQESCMHTMFLHLEQLLLGKLLGNFLLLTDTQFWIGERGCFLKPYPPEMILNMSKMFLKVRSKFLKAKNKFLKMRGNQLDHLKKNRRSKASTRRRDKKNMVLSKSPADIRKQIISTGSIEIYVGSVGLCSTSQGWTRSVGLHTTYY